jgi:membrane-anchored mycosin MYCP
MRRLVVAVLLLGSVFIGVAARPAAARVQCAEPGPEEVSVPWAQRMLAPDRVWPFTSGSGVTVAVLDSGIDGRLRQLRGRVLRGYDAMTRRAGANSDCLGTGTHVAGVIGAGRVDTVRLAGVAPDVSLLPVRVLSENAAASPAALARGIAWAVDQGADVIDVSQPVYVDDAGLRSAVARALERGVVVVAAVGDRDTEHGDDVRTYPAAYDGVIGVGAVDQGGVLWPQSRVGPDVDLVAPGAAVLTLQTGSGKAVVDGTAVASGFVAGTAALVVARRGRLAPTAVQNLLRDTATPAAEGTDTGRYGHGVVNPYAAVTELTGPGRTEGDLPALVRPDERDAAWSRSERIAVSALVVAALAALGVLALALALPHGRRRFWRAGVAPPPPPVEQPRDPGPPVQLFEQR